MKSYVVQSANVELVVAKAKNNNAHKKASKPSAVKLANNAKFFTLWLSAKKKGTITHPTTFKISVETDNSLIATIEALKVVRSFGFKDHEIIELDRAQGRGNPE